MHMRTAVGIALGVLLPAWGSTADGSGSAAGTATLRSQDTECESWEACRTAALAAEAAEDFERFHDLAWRAMQRRGRPDPDVMVMLARAQALSGRPHDSLVMLKRIAELGVVPDGALTEAAFERTRRLAGWPDVRQAIERVSGSVADQDSVPGEVPGTPPPEPVGARSDVTPERPAPAVSSAPAATAAPPPGFDAAREAASSAPSVAPPQAAEPPSAPPSAAALPEKPAVSEGAASTPAFAPREAIRFRVPGLVPAGLAYDAASGRFLVGNRVARTVVTISERLQAAADLVRAASAGFQDVRAIAIDARRGDLWVASSRDGGAPESDAPVAAIHKLQLVSGRPLETIPVEADGEAPLFSALAVDPHGSVFALDRSGSRVWRLRPGAKSATLAARLEVLEPQAMALDPAAGRAYVAHADGLIRLSLADRSTRGVAGPEGVGLAAIESLAWHRGTLIAIERAADAPRRLLRLRLNAGGTRVLQVELLDPDVTTCGGPGLVTVSEAEVFYLAGETEGQECTLIVRHLTIRP